MYNVYLESEYYMGIILKLKYVELLKRDLVFNFRLLFIILENLKIYVGFFFFFIIIREINEISFNFWVVLRFCDVYWEGLRR